MADELIAVTEASGELGSRVARYLGERGVRQRLVVRHPEMAPEAGADVAVASFEDHDALRAALEGVTTVFLVSGHEDPGRIELHRNAVAVIAEAEVQRVVYTSFMGAAPHATFICARDNALTEMAIRDAGLHLTVLRNSLYADIVPEFVGEDDVIRGPAGRGRVAWVAREDVARLATAVLLDPSHADQIYDVSGPVAIDLYETARLLSQVTGRDIAYQPETVEEARASRTGAQEWQIDSWVGSYAAIATGEVSVTSHTVEHVTGRRPWTFEEFLNAEPDAWLHLV
jgi:NAD(P)H dehydrogenase (quinone)